MESLIDSIRENSVRGPELTMILCLPWQCLKHATIRSVPGNGVAVNRDKDDTNKSIGIAVIVD